MTMFSWSDVAGKITGHADFLLEDQEGRRVGMSALIFRDDDKLKLNCFITRDGEPFRMDHAAPSRVDEVGSLASGKAIAEQKASRAKKRYLTDESCAGKYKVIRP